MSRRGLELPNMQPTSSLRIMANMNRSSLTSVCWTGATAVTTPRPAFFTRFIMGWMRSPSATPTVRMALSAMAPWVISARRRAASSIDAAVEEAALLLAEMTQGAMADKAILTVGVAEGDLIQPMMNLVKKAGRGVVTAVAPVQQTDVKLDLFMFAMMRKELVGCIFGNSNPRRDIPRLLNFYMEGKLLLDELVTNTYTLDEINQGYQDMRDGTNIRGVIHY